MDVRGISTADLKHGSTIEDVAQHLCRSGTLEDVRRKAEELGLMKRPELVRLSRVARVHASALF
jgi:hypothetical protein